ncbi:MAG: tRNA epoxyqueuosine(34) reductase QueG [Prevotella sp.]|nr:tRNA epoxyqueuosine(34) reductase QueG [Prevotella sp.]
MSSRLSSDIIKAEAHDLGFFACGIAKAEPVDDSYASLFKNWIAHKGHADMEYMSNNIDKRLDPRLLLDNAKSIICVALNYAPARSLPKQELQIAAYALGHDYHDIVKKKLHTLAAKLGISHYRAFCDSAPVLEQYWAAKAGIGWIGRNCQLIIPHAGSMFFLGELLIDVETEYDSPTKPRCGKCHACIDACPTGALKEVNSIAFENDVNNETDVNGTMLNASLCLSYQTIENRNDIPAEIAAKLENRIYGCDVCLNACPWNRFATPTNEDLLQPKEQLLQMTREKWQYLSEDDYRKIFKGSAVKRAGFAKLMRCINLASKQNFTHL